MKKLELKTAGEPPRPVDYDMLAAVMSGPTGLERGMDLTEMRSSFRILDVLKKAGPGAVEIEFEDEDFRILAGKIQQARWEFVSPQVLDLVDRIVAAQTAS